MRVAVVIPCYNVDSTIDGVVRSLPEWVARIIAVDDASSDGTAAALERLAAEDTRVTVLRHERNQGVGGAMRSGYREALAGDADIVVKVDGDGQHDPAWLPELLRPLLEGRADYAKGNRFRHVADLRRMPRLRLLGNIALTFLTKLASGYWHIFDAQNGFLAIRREALEALPLDKIDRTYAFENSMLSLLNIESWAVADVSVPAVYAGEASSMRLGRALFSFPPRLARMFARRIFLKYLIYDVSPVSIYLIVGTLLLGFGVAFGSYHWWRSIVTGVPATTGTVVLALLPFLMGFMLFLQAINLDIAASPRPRRPQRRLATEEVPAALQEAPERAVGAPRR